jgi:hypothetical protein
MKKDLKRAVSPDDWRWMEPMSAGLYSLYTKHIAPRRRTSVIDTDSADSVISTYVKHVAQIIPQASDEVLRQRIAAGDADAMMQLADANMFQFRCKAEDRDTHLACELYHDAAELGHPEANVQIAMLHYAKLNTDRRGDFDFCRPTRRPRSVEEKSLLAGMWQSLELAASMDYISPFLLAHAFNTQQDKSWKLSNTILSVLARRQDSIAATAENTNRTSPNSGKNPLPNPSPSPSTKWSVKTSAALGLQMGEIKCYNPACPHQDYTTVKFMKCGKCLVAAYCGVQCQRHDWKKHKTECDDMAQPNW